jgi:hypothetical protein
MEYTPKKFHAKMQHEQDVALDVKVLLAENEATDGKAGAGEVINTVLTEYLTEREVKMLVTKILTRNKVAHTMVKDYLYKS